MDHLEQTRKALEEANEHVLRGFQISVPPIKAILAEIRTTCLQVEREAPNSTEIEKAIRAFENSGMIENARQTKLLCYGLINPVFRNGSILEHAGSLQKLLEAVDGLKDRSTQFRRCYFGLMVGYFNYDRASTRGDGLTCSARLRLYLKDNLARLGSQERKPEWATLLLGNADVLGDKPGEYYGRQILNSGHDNFDALVHGLNIQPTSWLITDTVLGRIEVASTYTDQRFVSLIGVILERLAEHRMVLEQGLAMVLTRYSRSADRSVHSELRDFSVREWGNPWLSTNLVRWRFVEDTTRNMVSEWLKREIVQAFFDLLSQDGNNNRRRFNFWSKYIKQISDMYFVLGKNALSDQREDFVKIREKMGDRLLSLSHGQNADNAFIMRFNDYAIVEFGQHGNATYVFEWTKLPFELQHDVPVNRGALRSDEHRLKLHHRTIGGADWESVYSTKLYTELGIREDVYAERRFGRVDNIQIPSQEPSMNSIQAGKLNPHDMPRALIEYCKERSFKMDDFRSIGGRLWVKTDDSSPAVNEKLKSLGCRYVEKKTSWYQVG